MSETPEQRSRTMRAVRSRDTAPEMIVRRFLHATGLRFRLHDRSLPGVPDLVFPSRRIALFVHGCFWHQELCGIAFAIAELAETAGNPVCSVYQSRSSISAASKSGAASIMFPSCSARGLVFSPYTTAIGSPSKALPVQQGLNRLSGRKGRHLGVFCVRPTYVTLGRKRHLPR